MAAMANIVWFRGDTYPFGIVIKTSGSAIDITGYSFIMTIDTLENPPDGTTEVFSVNGVLSDPANGKATFTPTAINTDIAHKTYYYDIQMTDTSSNIKTIAKGAFIIQQDITK